MKLITFLLLGSVCASAYAAEAREVQPAPPPPPLDAKNGQPEQPAPPAAPAESPEGEPSVTITNQEVLTVKELRVGGRLYALKVTPKHGKSYYLVDSLGDGKFARQESLDSGVRVPLWVIKKF